jgi:hypothetical protein
VRKCEGCENVKCEAEVQQLKMYHSSNVAALQKSPWCYAIPSGYTSRDLYTAHAP